MRTKPFLLAGAALAGFAWSPAAFAQDESEAADYNAPIVVTAQFREQALQDTPLAITAITSDTLAERGQASVYEIANQVPNVTLKPSVAAWGPSLVASIRGVGQYNFNPALEPGVGVFVDDVYYATLTGSLLELLDLERVEVLRGPQGTLTGRNSIGGAVRMITKQPTGDNSGFIEATGGSRKLVGLRGAIDLAVTDTISARISAMVKSQDGYIENLDYGCVNPNPDIPATVSSSDCKRGPNMGGTGNQAIRGQLRFEPNDQFDFTLTGNYTREDRMSAGPVLRSANFDNPETNPVPGVPYDARFICGPYCNYATFQNGPGRDGYPAFASQVDPRTYFEGFGISGNANYDFTDTLSLTSITAYREYTSSFGMDGDLSPARQDLSQIDLKHRFFSQEARVNADLGMATLTVGGFYSWQQTDMNYFLDVRPYFLQYTTDDEIPGNTLAAFATAIVNVTDAMTVTAGIRYTEEEKTYNYNQFRLDGSVNDPALQGQSGTYDDSVVDYRLSVDYRWSDNFLTYATFATGFKGGGTNPFPAAPALILPFAPEKLKNYEIGFKSDFLNNRVRFNLTGFLNEYDGVQLTRLDVAEFGFDFGSLIVNAGNATTKGIEAEFSAEPVDGFNLNASASYLNFEFDYVDPATFLTTDVVPPFTPEWKWAAGAQYEIDLGNSSLTPRIDVVYQSSIYTNAANAPSNQIDEYTVANAHLTWKNYEGDLSIALHVNNLFDEYYLLNNFDLSGSSGIVQDFPAAPREFSVVLRKDF